MNEFLKQVLGESQSSFITKFEERWQNHISNFPEKYSKGDQFIIGARFRPVLVYWGYVLSKEKLLDDKNLEEVVHLALHIELLHKATLLIDDLIDNDNLRHGKKSFHAQFSEHEAILFAIYLVGDSLDQLSQSIDSAKSEIKSNLIGIFSGTIKEMVLGVLKELNLKDNEYSSINTIKEIIENQTISIIKNSLLIGYEFGIGNKFKYSFIDIIGYDCGYIFQLLNDLEPFENSQQNAIHKGRNNIDLINYRKNIIVAFILNEISISDKECGSTYFKDKPSELLDMFHKYAVIEVILKNLEDVRKNIVDNILGLKSQSNSPQVVESFNTFLNFLFERAIERVGGQYQTRLSEILIR